MIESAEHDIAHCLQRTEEAKRMGETETDPIRKQEYADMEARWVRLATIYQLAAQYNAFPHHASSDSKPGSRRSQRSASSLPIERRAPARARRSWRQKMSSNCATISACP